MSAKISKTAKQVKVTLVKSTNGRTERQKACVKGLGLRKIGSTRVLELSKPVEGMINKVSFLITAEEV